MARSPWSRNRTKPCSPHPRGDGPISTRPPRWPSRFSPPAWGWPAAGDGLGRKGDVLPTRVGMARLSSPPGMTSKRSPHPRGDGPVWNGPKQEFRWFSPPAWGWPDMRSAMEKLPAVLPTRVGMARRAMVARSSSACSPHPRGDGPLAGSPLSPGARFSPPAWGWPGERVVATGLDEVLPTRVGMARGMSSAARQPASSPHPRGDGPQYQRGLALCLAVVT